MKHDVAPGGYVGRSVPRREDRRLLLGRGQFVADLKLPDTLHAVFVRSQVAHARIRSVDLSRAATAPGVAYVLNGAELAQLVSPGARHPVVAAAEMDRAGATHVPQSTAAAACL